MNTALFPLALIIAVTFFPLIPFAASSVEEYNEDVIEFIEGENQLIYEYRKNGVLTMIKVVPKIGTPYYMVPLTGAQNVEGLDHQKKLYPQWVIKEW